MPNVFTARASWEAICGLSRNLCRPPVPEQGERIDSDSFRQYLCYKRGFDEVHDWMVVGEAEHEIVEGHIVWEGFPYGSDGICWNCHLGALVDLCLQEDGGYRIRFIGTNRYDFESVDLLRYLRAIDPDTLKVEQLDLDRLIKLAHHPTVTAGEVSMLKRFGREVVNKLLEPARKDAEEREEARALG